MRAMNDKYKLGVSIVAAPGYDEAYARWSQGRGDALAADDMLLNGPHRQPPRARAPCGSSATF